MPKISELSSREDFIIEQFATMKKVNTIASKYFDAYYIDIDHGTELSPMMRAMVPTYYVDPNNPLHPSCYVLAGKSTVPYLERLIHIFPFINKKNKYEYDISAYHGLLMNAVAFSQGVKGFRKTKLEPMVIVGKREGKPFNRNLILREAHSAPSGEISIPFLQLPNRKEVGTELYHKALQELVYAPFYQYMGDYLDQDLTFTPIGQDTIQTLIDDGAADVITKEGEYVTACKNLFPGIKNDHLFAIAKIPNPSIDVTYGRFHYIISESILNEMGSPYVTIYTLLAALQL